MSSINSERFSDIHFVNGTVHHDGIVYPIMDMVRIPLEGIRLYGEVFVRLTQLNHCSISLYFWCVMEMGRSMIILTDLHQRLRFLTYCKKLGFDYKDDTVKKAFRSIVNIGLMVSAGKGRCKINPEFCYRGSERERKEDIGQYKRNTKENNKYELHKGEVRKKDLIINL